ncbi:MAG TPA: acyl-CoA dehydrogenase family protein [Acidimicrobiales bacterium]|nr:acyl-CoA dehydrogenase family protein [Acidimicrobiales bacterium]
MNLSFSDSETAFAADARAWLRSHVVAPPAFASLDDEIAWGRTWQAALAADRWVGIHWPAEYGGRSATPVEVAIFNMEYARAGAPQPVNRVGINLVGPTVLAHGTENQRSRWLPAILTAEEIWCQLYSEPAAGSDLGSLRTKAVKVDGGWQLSGQKVWTSYAQFARWGLCLARTEAGRITCFGVDMTGAGIDIRPLVQITGSAEFNEVFLDDVFVPDDCVIGGVDDGWRVATTTLAHERGTTFPFKEQVVHEVYLDELFAAANLDDLEVADALVGAFIELRVLRLHNWRTLSRLSRGEEPGPESSIVKLAWTDMTQHLSDAALLVEGGESVLDGKWSRQWLWSKAASIAGGTSEIQKNIVGERLLGLPR